MHRLRTLLILLLLSSPLFGAEDEELSFDLEEFEPRFFEFGGYLEAKPELARANREGALYQLQFFGRNPDKYLERFTGTAELDGRLRKGIASVNVRTHSELVTGDGGDGSDHNLYRGYLSLRPQPGFGLDLGRQVMRWGTGYAWNPVAFVSRPKNPDDPDLSRKGYWIIAADWIRRFDGPLQTVALTPLILPVRSSLNEDFGESGHANPAAKLYLLYRDIDFDFMFLGDGSRKPRFGMDFAKNLAPNLAIHGEFAYFKDALHPTVTPDCQTGPVRRQDEISYLLGTRYLTRHDVTLILEYYRNGLGNKKRDQEQFYRCVQRAWDTGDRGLVDQLPLTNDPREGPFTRRNPMRRYMNFRLWWKEPFDLLYFTPGLQVLANLEDHSFSVIPETTYRGIEKVELRLRGNVPVGDSLSEWGERANKYRIELRARYYF